jgi:hypothetical protein
MLFASLLIAGQAGAKTLDFQGTLEITVSWVGEIIVHGSGVSTVNDTSGGAHLSTLRLAGGITGSGTVPITDPNQTGTLKSIRIAATIGTGTLTGISGAPPMGQNKLPIKGMTRICIFSPSCITNLPMNNTSNGTRGGGLGGLLTIGGMGSIRVSLWGAPWTLATVGATHQTGKGNFVTLSRVGFVHGAASGTNSSTAVNSGVIQMIAPQTATTIGTTGNSSAIALFNIMTLRFIPEPGLLLLLGAGVVGLGLLGRSRMKT